MSSERYKEEIRTLAATSEAIYALDRSRFRLKKNDDKSVRQFGLIAEEVAEVNPDLVRARQKWRDLHRALRLRERDVAQRVS